MDVSCAQVAQTKGTQLKVLNRNIKHTARYVSFFTWASKHLVYGHHVIHGATSIMAENLGRVLRPHTNRKNVVENYLKIYVRDKKQYNLMLRSGNLIDLH